MIQRESPGPVKRNLQITMTETEIKDKVREFILNEFMADLDPGELTDDMSFEGAHLVDSVGMMDLILFVEETFEFEVENLSLIHI